MIAHKPELSLPIYDQYFILEGAGVALSPKQEPPSNVTTNPTTQNTIPSQPNQSSVELQTNPIMGVAPVGYGS